MRWTRKIKTVNLVERNSRFIPFFLPFFYCAMARTEFETLFCFLLYILAIIGACGKCEIG